MTIQDTHFNRQELADFLGISIRTVIEMDTARTGPPRLKMGGRIWYPKARVTEWLEAKAQQQARAPQLDPAA